MSATTSTTAQQTLTVAQLTAQIKDSLEGEFPERLGGRRDLELLAAAVGPFAISRSRTTRPKSRAVMWRGTIVATEVRSCRRPRRHLPRPSRRLRAARQLPIGRRPAAAQGRRGAGTRAAEAARKAGGRRACSIRPANASCRPFRGGWRLSPAPPARPCAIFSKCCGGAGAASTC